MLGVDGETILQGKPQNEPEYRSGKCQFGIERGQAAEDGDCE